MEVDIDQGVPLDTSEQYYEDDATPLEQEVDQYDDQAEEQVIPIIYENDDGDEVTEELPLSEVSKLVAAARRGPEPNKAEEILNEIEPFLQRVSQSSLLQWVHYYQDQGLTDEQVMQKLYQEMVKRGMSAEEEEDEINDVGKIKQKIYEEQVLPLQRKLEQIERAQGQNLITENNRRVLNTALSKNGWDENKMTADDVDRIYKTITTLYPNISLTDYRLQQKQADLIIGMSLGSKKKGQGAQQSAANIVRQASAPKIMPGTKGQQQQAPPKLPSMDGMSLGERIALKKKIFL